MTGVNAIMTSPPTQSHDSGTAVRIAAASQLSVMPIGSILTILPAALFILASPIHIWRSRHEHVHILPSSLVYWKIAATISLVGLECIVLSLWTSSSTYCSTASVAAHVLGTISALLVSIIVYIKHCYAMRSSSLVTIYLFVGILCDVVKIRTMLSHAGFTMIAMSSIAALTLKTIITALEEIPKRQYLGDTALRKKTSNDSLSGFWTRYLFTWLNRTARLGFKSVITIDDLANLDSSFASADLSAKFGSNLANVRGKYALFHAAVKTLPKQLFFVAIPRLAYALCTYLQPSLIQRAIYFVEQDTNRFSEQTRCCLFVGTAAIFAGIALFRAVYSYHNYRLIVLLRGCLMGQIFEKLQRLSYPQAKHSSAMTLMSADMDMMVNGLVKIHDVWAAPFEIATGIFLLHKISHPAAYYVLLPTFSCLLLAVYVGRKVGPLKATWNEQIESRTVKTSEILSQMKSLKMMGLETTASACIDKLRSIEVDSFRAHRKLATAITVISVLAFSMTPVIGMTGAVIWSGDVDIVTPAKAFTALSIIALIVSPVTNILNAALIVPPTFACFVRMQHFLVLDEPRDRRRFGDDRNRQQQLGEAGSALSRRAEKRAAKRKKRWPPILALKLSICFPGSPEYLLHLASFAIGENSLTMLLGPTGSGKTTLLRTLMGEVQYYGSIGLSQRSIAYCGQVPWIQNASLRQNIVGPMRFDPTWYDTVLNACLLHEDIQQLQHGDATIVGTDGVAISGGQRQRVVLARAVYSRAQVIVLDGVCSSLDDATTCRIFHNLFGKFGLLRKPHCTVILSTNLAKYVDFADKLLVLDGSGRLTSQSLARGTPASPQLVKRIASPAVAPSEETGTISAHHEALQSAGLEVSLEGEVRNGEDNDFYWLYLTSARGRQIALYVLMVLAVAATERIPHIFLSKWLREDSSSKHQFMSYVFICTSSGILAISMMTLYLVEIVPQAADAVHQELLRTVMGSRLSFLTSTDMVFVLNRFSQDMTVLTQSLPLAVHQFIYLAMWLAIDVAVVAMAARHTVVIIPALVIIAYYVQAFYVRTSRQLRHFDLEARKPLYTLLAEATKGLEHIRSFRWRPPMLQRMFRALDRSQKATYYMFATQRWLELVLDLITGAIAVIIMAAAMYAKNATSPATFGLSMVALVGFGQSMGGLTQKWNTLEAALGAVSRLRSFINTTPQETTIWGGSDFQSSNLPRYGNVAFRSISAKYNPTDTRNALNKISMEIDDGCTVGLVGRTGSGKSSIFAALLNMIEFRGIITIDGIDISTIPQNVLRSQLITTITQDPIRLPGSIKDNLLPYPEQQIDGYIKEFDVLEALGKVGLKQVIASKGGLDSPMSDAEFTPGQMQMFSIARAILHNVYVDSRIILIDEATGSMDTELEDGIMPVLRQAFKECTVLVITHRPETLEDGQRIVEMHNGRIAAVF